MVYLIDILFFSAQFYLQHSYKRICAAVKSNCGVKSDEAEA